MRARLVEGENATGVCVCVREFVWTHVKPTQLSRFPATTGVWPPVVAGAAKLWAEPNGEYFRREGTGKSQRTFRKMAIFFVFTFVLHLIFFFRRVGMSDVSLELDQNAAARWYVELELEFTGALYGALSLVELELRICVN